MILPASYIIISHCIAIIFAVLFSMFFYKLLKNQKLLFSSIEVLTVSFEKVDYDNSKFKESSVIPEQLEANSLEYLKTLHIQNDEVRLACKNGIKEAGYYFKKVYFSKHYVDKYELDNLINIFKRIRTNVNYDNITFYCDNNNIYRDLFLRDLTNYLRNHIPEIIGNVKKFRAAEYNGKSFDVYMKMCTETIHSILKGVHNIYSDYAIKAETNFK